MRNKRGLSDVVVTLIMIVLVLIAIGVVWAVVQGLITKSTDDISLEKLTINLEIVSAEKIENNLEVLVKRNPGDGELKGLRFAIQGTNGVVIIDSIAYEAQLDELDSYKFIFAPNDFTEAGTDLQQVSIYPIFGEDSYGDLADSFVLGNPTKAPEITKLSVFRNGSEYTCGEGDEDECNLGTVRGEIFYVNLEAKAVDSNIESYTIKIYKADNTSLIFGSCGKTNLNLKNLDTYDPNKLFECPFVIINPNQEGKAKITATVTNQEGISSTIEKTYDYYL